MRKYIIVICLLFSLLYNTFSNESELTDDVPADYRIFVSSNSSKYFASSKSYIKIGVIDYIFNKFDYYWLSYKYRKLFNFIIFLCYYKPDIDIYPDFKTWFNIEDSVEIINSKDVRLKAILLLGKTDCQEAINEFYKILEIENDIDIKNEIVKTIMTMSFKNNKLEGKDKFYKSTELKIIAISELEKMDSQEAVDELQNILEIEKDRKIKKKIVDTILDMSKKNKSLKTKGKLYYFFKKYFN